MPSLFPSSAIEHSESLQHPVGGVGVGVGESELHDGVGAR